MYRHTRVCFRIACFLLRHFNSTHLTSCLTVKRVKQIALLFHPCSHVHQSFVITQKPQDATLMSKFSLLLTKRHNLSEFFWIRMYSGAWVSNIYMATLLYIAKIYAVYVLFVVIVYLKSTELLSSVLHNATDKPFDEK